MTRPSHGLLALAALFGLGACPTPNLPADAGGDVDAGEPPGPLAASDYCETIAPFFWLSVMAECWPRNHCWKGAS